MIKLSILLDENNIVARSDGQSFAVPPKQWADFVTRTSKDDFIVGGTSMRAAPAEFLGGRNAYVLTRQPEFENANVVNSVEAAQELFKQYRGANKNLWILGGKQAYETLAPYADEIIVSVSKQKYDADLKINWDLTNYHRKEIKQEVDFTVYQYTKVKK